jgi:hypothetical protein
VFPTPGCSEGLQGVLFCCFEVATIEGEVDGSGFLMAQMAKNINALL